MSEDKDSWSSEELKTRLNQELAIEFIKLREKETGKPASAWLSVLQSNVVATLITVCLGTIFGGILADRIQETNRKNDEMRVQHQANLQLEEKTVEEAFTVVAKTVSSSQELIDISGEAFNENNPNLPQETKASLSIQKGKIWAEYDAAIANWRIERERLGLLLRLRHNNPGDIGKSWNDLVTSVNVFSQCAVLANKQIESLPDRPPDLEYVCGGPRWKLHEAMGEITNLIGDKHTNADKPSRFFALFKK
jgi:hypothetical protein